MARKDISRTTIEGGRSRPNKLERRRSNAEFRVRSARFVRRISKDLSVYDLELPPERVKVYKDFADRLSPLRRWLKSQDGRPWEELFAKIKVTFDDRTTAGRHILEHLFQEIRQRRPDGSWFISRETIVVDRAGIIRVPPSFMADDATWSEFEAITAEEPRWGVPRSREIGGSGEHSFKHGKSPKHWARVKKAKDRKAALAKE